MKRKIHTGNAIGVIVASLMIAVPAVAMAGPATSTTTGSTSCSCPTSCAAQKHFNDMAKVNLALGQPPNPSTSFAQGCLGSLDQLNIGNLFSGGGLPSISSVLQSLEKKIINEACSAVTSTMNNEISQGNSILSFSLSPATLEQEALNGVTGTVLKAEQKGLNMGTSAVNDSTGSYVSEGGNAVSDGKATVGNALSGNWVNNLY
ncbi:hypothetical protein HFU84_08540 [Acidithiobacillus sp. CV18-2]|nr:hypothetical protein [Acidithiobacillus sp. CV18-3]MBU2756939.1 hypothetical protein [Acidithiobacillus sp. BN09-2]MBU2777550.1 hypothetical protein [Acidithiobacillus sp. CV18-2]MBU2799650.1 hypothetical protein [Acidithiobacillus sp. VAN18-4]